MSIVDRVLFAAPFVTVLAACTPPVSATTATLPTATVDSAAIDSVAARYFALGMAPGMAVAVVRGDRPAFIGGFGHADLEARRPITPQTVFYIASTTKAFTGLAAAIHHHRGTIDLDAPLSRYIPEARLYEPLSAGAITLRSLLSHTHGISNAGPVVWRTAFSGEFEGNEHLVRLLAEHPPAPGGTAYAYGNIGYNVAALALDRALGKSWKNVLSDEIFRPLGMTSTSAYVSRAPEGQRAMPYVLAPTGFDRAHYLKTDANMQAAGGLVSTAADLARWLEAQMNGGRLDGAQAIPAAALAESQRRQAAVDADIRGMRQVGYSLGWQMLLRGTDTLFVHGGGFTGFSTLISFLPAQRVGVAVMVNESTMGGALADVVTRAIYERLAGPAPGAGVPADVEAGLQRMRAPVIADRERRAARSQVLPHPLSAYVGVYENPAFGRLELRQVGDRLEAVAGTARSPVEVFDAMRNMLRVELSGSGTVIAVEMEGGRAARLRWNNVVFSRQ